MFKNMERFILFCSSRFLLFSFCTVARHPAICVIQDRWVSSHWCEMCSNERLLLGCIYRLYSFPLCVCMCRIVPLFPLVYNAPAVNSPHVSKQKNIHSHLTKWSTVEITWALYVSKFIKYLHLAKFSFICVSVVQSAVHLKTSSSAYEPELLILI